MSINHLSASSIDTFQRCQLQWYHRYVLGERQPPSIALVQGGSVHKSAEYEYAYKLEAGEDAPLDECLDVARDTFKLEAEQVEDWEGTKPSAVLDETVNLARLYREELAPAVMPVSVERELLISDESWRWPLLGYTDVEEIGRVIDIKTAKAKKSQSDLDNSVQAGIYLLDRHRAGRPEAFTWHVVTKAKTPQAQTIDRTVIDHERTVRYVAAIQAGIHQALESGVFLPAQPDSWTCSERFCGWYRQCPYGGGKA